MARGNRRIPNNPTGQSPAPRLKGVDGGSKSTFKRGDGATTPGRKGADVTDKSAFKRGDSAGPKGSQAGVDAKFKRGDSKLSKMPEQLNPKFSRGE